MENNPDLHTPNTGKTLKALWSITSFYFGNNPEWSEEEAKKMLFKPLFIDSSSIIFDKRSCQDIVSQTSSVDAAKYFSTKYKTMPDVISYEHDTLKVVKTNCHLEGFSEYMRLRDRRVVIHLHGIYFIFDPIVNY
ncbi:MAG: hypothetical protein D3923_06210 [Candidatus Electrothrix sp. AR3]|nr:hypothetical protein [Candidatus Electrothrix sp. AR3]